MIEEAVMYGRLCKHEVDLQWMKEFQMNCKKKKDMLWKFGTNNFWRFDEFRQQIWAKNSTINISFRKKSSWFSGIESFLP